MNCFASTNMGKLMRIRRSLCRTRYSLRITSTKSLSTRKSNSSLKIQRRRWPWGSMPWELIHNYSLTPPKTIPLNWRISCLAGAQSISCSVFRVVRPVSTQKASWLRPPIHLHCTRRSIAATALLWSCQISPMILHWSNFLCASSMKSYQNTTWISA